MLCARLAPCCHTRAAVAALAHLSGAALHAAPRRAFGAGSSSSTGGGAAAAGSRAAHVCRSYADPEVYSIAFNFRKFDQEVINELRNAHQWQHCPLCDPPTGIAAFLQVAHLLAMHQKHCSGALHHFLEVACGPAQVGQTGVPLVTCARCLLCSVVFVLSATGALASSCVHTACSLSLCMQHAILLAKTAGCAATGLDLSPAMLAYAARQAEAAGAARSLSFVEADMSKGALVALLGCRHVVQM